jgi:hypothetical protein
MTTAFHIARPASNRAEATTPIATTDGGPFPVTGQAVVALEC